MLSDHYQPHTINGFKKLLEQEDEENISKVATPILVTISMHIVLTRLLEVGPINIKYDLEKRLSTGYTCANWGN